MPRKPKPRVYRPLKRETALAMGAKPEFMTDEEWRFFRHITHAPLAEWIRDNPRKVKLAQESWKRAVKRAAIRKRKFLFPRLWKIFGIPEKYRAKLLNRP